MAGGFAYQVHISGWVSVVAGMVAFVIALVTVNVPSIKAVVANPVKSLRTK